jgi:hypothetical protein
MDQLGGFSEQKQSTLLSIKAHMELLNQEIDLARHYMDMTFDSSLDAGNYAAVLDNVKTRYRARGRRSGNHRESHQQTG